MTIENFVVHPTRGSEQRTDADLIAVRFVHRVENVIRPMEDDYLVADCGSLINLIIAEVKTSRCSLNGPWTEPDKNNLQLVFGAIGCFTEDVIDTACERIYSEGQFSTETVSCRLMAFGDVESELTISNVPQITFDTMLRFIHSRFREYRSEKSSVGNWARDGWILASLARSAESFEVFCQEARRYFGLPASTSQGTMRGE